MAWNKQSKTKEPENAAKAYDYAVFLLSLNLRTVGEMVRKMQQRGYTERVTQETIDQLKEQRYLDDRRYAEIFLENLKAYRNFGFYGIKKKMMQKRLPGELIDEVLEDGLSQEEEIKIAKRLLKKEGFVAKLSAKDDVAEAIGLQYSSYGDEKQNKEKQKLAQKLKSRGFRGDVIASLVF